MTRRRALAGAATLGVLEGARRALAKASQPATPVNLRSSCERLRLPHAHHRPRGSVPLLAGPDLYAGAGSSEEMAALHRALHITRVVIVTPSVYGTDNSATLYGMKARGKNARGVAVIDAKTPARELDAMGAAGVRGIRLNLATVGQTDPSVGRRRFQKSAPHSGPRLACANLRRPARYRGH